MKLVSQVFNKKIEDIEKILGMLGTIYEKNLNFGKWDLKESQLYQFVIDSSWCLYFSFF